MSARLFVLLSYSFYLLVREQLHLISAGGP